eukprot:scaffold78740_cov62-Phaeocystis_antarctica.AAC.4
MPTSGSSGTASNLTASYFIVLPEVREFIRDAKPRTNTTRGGRGARHPKTTLPLQTCSKPPASHGVPASEEVCQPLPRDCVLYGMFITDALRTGVGGYTRLDTETRESGYIRVPTILDRGVCSPLGLRRIAPKRRCHAAYWRARNGAPRSYRLESIRRRRPRGADLRCQAVPT